MAKSISQLESLNRELQERGRGADGEKAQLEKELLVLQSTLDSERRNYSQGSEEIRELQGDPRMMTLINGNLTLKCIIQITVCSVSSLIFITSEWGGGVIEGHFLKDSQVFDIQILSYLNGC